MPKKPKSSSHQPAADQQANVPFVQIKEAILKVLAFHDLHSRGRADIEQSPKPEAISDQEWRRWMCAVARGGKIMPKRGAYEATIHTLAQEKIGAFPVEDLRVALDDLRVYGLVQCDRDSGTPVWSLTNKGRENRGLEPLAEDKPEQSPAGLSAHRDRNREVGAILRHRSQQGDELELLLLHLSAAPEHGVPVRDLPRELRDADRLTVWDADGLIEFGHRNHCFTGPEMTPHLDNGWDFGSLTGPNKKPMCLTIGEAERDEGDPRIRLHVRLTQKGRAEASRLRLRGGGGQTAKPVGTSGDAANKLTDRQRWILEAMLKLEALDRESRRTTAEIACKAENRDANPDNFKQPMADLSMNGYVESKRGGQGGVWLTTKGRELAAFLANR